MLPICIAAFETGVRSLERQRRILSSFLWLGNASTGTLPTSVCPRATLPVRVFVFTKARSTRFNMSRDRNEIFGVLFRRVIVESSPSDSPLTPSRRLCLCIQDASFDVLNCGTFALSTFAAFGLVRSMHARPGYAFIAAVSISIISLLPLGFSALPFLPSFLLPLPRGSRLLVLVLFACYGLGLSCFLTSGLINGRLSAFGGPVLCSGLRNASITIGTKVRKSFFYLLLRGRLRGVSET